MKRSRGVFAIRFGSTKSRSLKALRYCNRRTVAGFRGTEMQNPSRLAGNSGHGGRLQVATGPALYDD